jgi:hypothetical protein
MAILRIFLLMATIFTSWPSYSAVLKRDTSKEKQTDYTFKDFCQTMKAKDLSLISVTAPDEIECFNQKFKIIDFCLQKIPFAKHVTRGYANEKEKKVYCEEAQSVMISVSCDERDLRFCLDPKKGCEMLKKIYAYRLETVHYSMLEKNLNCYYSKPLGDTLDEN